MNTKNVVIATIVGATLLGSVIIPTKVGINEVAKVPSVHADVPYTLELPFLYSQNLLTSNVQKDGLAFSKATTVPNATPIAYKAENSQKVAEPIVYQAPRQESVKEGKDSLKKYEVPLSDDLQKYTQDLCDKYGISYELILAIIRQESNFDPVLVSETNDYGIMQINRGNFQAVHKYMKSEFGIENFNWKNPYHNIAAGIYWFKITKDEMLSMGFSEEGIFPRTILAYNMGTPNARRYLKSHSAYDWKYVKAVTYYKNKLEKGESINDTKANGVAS